MVRRTTATLAECEVWAAASKAKTIAGLPGIQDIEKRKWVEASTLADFSVLERDNMLVFENVIMRAEIRYQKVDAGQLKQINMFRMLNAYHKGLINGLSPFMDIRQGNELMRRGVIPLETVSRISLGKDIQTVSSIKTTISHLSQLERSVVNKTLNELTKPINTPSERN